MSAHGTSECVPRNPLKFPRRQGEVVAGTASTFGVERVSSGVASGFEAWVEDENGEQLSPPVGGEGHDSHWHFTITPSHGIPTTFVLRLEKEIVKVGIFPGAAPCQHGILAPLIGKFQGAGLPTGFVEVKLHDDLGDLELWVTHSGASSSPLDFALDTPVQLTFMSHADKSVSLRVRNTEQNEDEEGVPNVRGAPDASPGTNYFIFPGESGEDAAWLTGKDFRATVKVSIGSGGTALTSEPFVLVPHSH
jgi:hypothetical protein